MTVELIVAIVGVIVSLCLEYIPKFSDWYNALPNTTQRLIALGIGFGVVAGAFGLGCANLIVPYWPCNAAGGWLAVSAFIAYMVANQVTYLVLPKPQRHLIKAR